MKIKYSKYVVLLWIVFVSLSLSITHIITKNKVDKLIDQKAMIAAKNMQSEVSLMIQNKKNSMVAIALAIAENKSLKEALLTKNYKLKQLNQFSKKLRESTKYKNVWFQVIDKEGKSFFRSWIDKRGDNLIDVRLDVAKMIEKPQLISSISVGKFDLTFKASVPIFANEKFIGLFEIITHFNSIAVSLIQEDIDSLFVVDRSYKNQLTNAWTKIFIDDYYIANLNAKEYFLDLLRLEGVEKFIDIGKNYIIDQERNLFITTVPILDIYGKKMAHAIMFKRVDKAIDIQDIEKVHKENAIYLMFFIILFTVLGYFFMYKRYNDKLKKNLFEIKFQKEKVSTIIDSQPSIIILTNGKELLEVNESFFKFFSDFKRLKEFKKKYKCICDFFDPHIKEKDYITSKENWLERVLENKKKNLKVVMEKNGKKHHFILHGKRKRLSSGEINIVTFIDITREKQQDKLIYEKNKLASLGEMIGNIAHQWRQPLSAISGGASGIIVQKEMDILSDEKLISEMENIIEKTQYLSQTINTFKDFIKSNKTYAVTTLESEIKKAIKLEKSNFTNHNVTLIDTIDYDNGVSFSMVVDELPQVIISIINNSLDVFTHNNIDNPTIKLSLKTIKNLTLITIEDNGGGIPKDIIDKIFEPYFTTKHQSQGTGLGLHICFRIITESFGGKILAENGKEGAKFLIEIPHKLI